MVSLQDRTRVTVPSRRLRASRLLILNTTKSRFRTEMPKSCYQIISSIMITKRKQKFLRLILRISIYKKETTNKSLNLTLKCLPKVAPSNSSLSLTQIIPFLVSGSRFRPRVMDSSSFLSSKGSPFRSA